MKGSGKASLNRLKSLTERVLFRQGKGFDCLKKRGKKVHYLKVGEMWSIKVAWIYLLDVLINGNREIESMHRSF